MNTNTTKYVHANYKALMTTYSFRDYWYYQVLVRIIKLHYVETMVQS